MQTYIEKQKTAFDALKGTFGYTNRMQAPKVEKIVISTGIGKINDPKKVELIQNRIARITGQKAAPRAAKQSIASFKLREGDIVGYQVTLRGTRMRDFLDKLIHIAFPRTRDFRGIAPKSIDEIGNVSVGIKEHTIFPETSDEEQRDIFGLSITIVTTARSKEEADAYLRHIGFPLKQK